MNTLSSTPLCASNRSWAKVSSSSSQKLTSRYFQAKGRRKGATFQISESGCGRYSFGTTICSATSGSTGDAGNVESQKFKEDLSFDKTLQSENWNFSEFTHENKLPPLLPWADAMALSRSNVPITQKDDSTSSSQKEVIELVRDDPSEVKEESSRADFIGLGPFKTAVGAFLYEKGYRQLFRLLGFPGVDAEYALATSQLEKSCRRENSTLLDMSCGPGMFAERFARASVFDTVVACDYSNAMCNETASRVLRSNLQEKISIVRSSVSDLPFDANTFDAIHSGAGMHCWPDVSCGLSELTRTLRPGGCFVASTVVLPEKARSKMIAKGIKNGEMYAKGPRQQNMPFWDVDAVVNICKSVGGLEDVEVLQSEKSFVMIKAKKKYPDNASKEAVENETEEAGESKVDDAGTPDILNHWWPLAFESELDSDKPVTAQLFGEPLVLFRSSNGNINCLQDRCAHKSCPLSLGYVSNGQLVCRYHGWSFGDKGKLEDVPCLRSCPKANVPGYPTFVSSDGIVHVWPGNREICKTKPIPSNVIADFSLKSTETLSWPKLTEIREWDGVPWYSAVEITQDFTHLQFVHKGTQTGRAPLLVGGLKTFETDLGHDVGDGAFIAEYVGGSGKGGGRVTFIPPSTVMNESFFVKEDPNSSNGLQAFPLCFLFHFIPVTSTKTKILVEIHQKLFPHLTDAASKKLMNMAKVMSQDQLVLAAQRLRVSQGSPQWNLPLDSDKHLLHFTRWREAAEGKGPWFLGYDDIPVPSGERDDFVSNLEHDVGPTTQRADLAEHPRPFHRPRSSVDGTRGSGGRTGMVRRGPPSLAGTDLSGMDMSVPLRALTRESEWEKFGVPLFLADAMNSARGKDVIERVTSGMDWAKGTWTKNAKAKKVKGGDDTDRGEGVLARK